MEAITDHDLGNALRDASQPTGREVRPSIVSVAAALRSRVADPADPLREPLGEIASALEYYPVDGCEHIVLQPAARPKSCACATSLAPSDPDVLPLWARALAHAPRPLVAARFADLLWCARYGDTPHVWAQRSIDASLASVYDEFGHVLEVAEGLQRALDIATESCDQPRRAAVLAALVGFADRSILSEEGSSGVALSIIESLAAQPPAARPQELEPLIERALHQYHDDPWLLEPALDIKARLVEPAARGGVHADQIEAFARLARGSSDLLRHAHFEHAIELAERNAMTERAEQLRSELDTGMSGEAPAAPADDAEQAQPADPVDEFVARIVGDDSLYEALARFGASLPTEGYGTAGGVAEQQRLSFFGGVSVNLLAQIAARYGRISGAGSWFECPLVDVSVASGIAEGIDRFESGDLDSAARVLALQLEQIMRSIASAAGMTDSTRVQSITEILDALSGALYEPSRRYLCALLPAAPSDASAPDTALLVHAACHLRLLQPVEVIRPETTRS